MSAIEIIIMVFAIILTLWTLIEVPFGIVINFMREYQWDYYTPDLVLALPAGAVTLWLWLFLH